MQLANICRHGVYRALHGVRYKQRQLPRVRCEFTILLE